MGISPFSILGSGSYLSPSKTVKPILSIAFMIFSTLCFVAVTVIVKLNGPVVPASEAAFLRYVAGLVMFIPFFYFTFFSNKKGEKTKQGNSLDLLVNWKWFLFRGVAHGLGVILWFYSMARLPIAEVTAIGYTTPIFVSIGAAIFLGERLAYRRIFAVIVAFIGMLIILRPGLEVLSLGRISQLLAAIFFSISYLLTKRLTYDSTPFMIVAMLTVYVTIALAPFAFYSWVKPTLEFVLWMSLVAVFASLGHYLMTKALQLAPIAVSQPVTFLQLIWAALIGFYFFGENIDIFVLAGGFIIFSSVVFISYRESIAAKVKLPN